MNSQITYTEKATKQQIKLNFIKEGLFSLYKMEQFKNKFMYKQSTNVLYYLCKHINNSLTQRSENHCISSSWI